MREIKFRAWHPALKKMFYDCRVGSEDWLDRSTHFGGDHDTLMQYTGLKDKNGVEIYEGDILAPMSNDYQPKYEGNWVVIFTEGAFFGESSNEYVETWLPYWKPDDEIEVIGNIYENKELLEPTPSKPQ